jgi:outer membrane receptor protein involved in Fe transport
LLASLLALPLPAVAQDATDETIAELVVTSQRREQAKILHAGNIDRLDATTIDRVQHQHIHELLTRVSGVWITRASGQEHLTAIRSPVLTGPGSCGAFLFLEDGIPTRPAGFCNVNSLFEIGTEFAQSVEVIRGPGNALYGSNALHGIVNVLMPGPVTGHAPLAALEVGANDFYRARASIPFDRDADWLASVLVADDGGFRDDSGYRQGKLHIKRYWDLDTGNFTLAMSASDLDQETAGFILGEDAYKDPDLNRANLNPEAFREASSRRLYGIWEGTLRDLELDVRPFLRHSSMRFLQHFLPGQPLEENGHVSGGILATATLVRPRHTLIFGVDVELADIYLEQSQDEPTQGSPFLVETRPAGKHYDFDASSVGVASYLQADYQLSEKLTLGAGLRADYLKYEYDNLMLTGNTRDDGTECGFGGCLYSRPADRTDSFTNLAPKLSLNYRLGDRGSLYANLARGFRAPQATELYRLQSGQQVADLDSERIDSFELGLRTSRDEWSVDVAVFDSRKRDSIYRDSEGFNVSGARSKHRGIEAAVDFQIGASWSIALDASYARHSYDFDVVASRGETFVSGRDVDTAPRLFGSLDVLYEPGGRFDFGLQWTTIGDYYLDAENQFRYPGHSIGNLRAGIAFSDSARLIMRLNNVTDRDIADRADYAFGNYRYFPGRGRELFAEIRYTPNESL